LQLFDDRELDSVALDDDFVPQIFTLFGSKIGDFRKDAR
jgi:hypothetical protein